VRWSLYLGFGLWLIAVAIGFGVVSSYDASPGKSGVAPPTWPDDVDVSRHDSVATLVMFLHPHCPCSRASLGELERLVARCHDHVAVRIMFVKPAGAGPDWCDSDLWRSAAQLPGVELAVDESGKLARRFGGETSGHVVLYDATGRLLYSGGITASRGHSGDNAGRLTMEQSLLDGTPPDLAGQSQPTFGCPLHSAEVTSPATAELNSP